MTNQPAQIGGEPEGSIAWSLFSHYHVPGLKWVVMAILLIELIGLATAVAALIAPRRFGRAARILAGMLAALGPLLGLLGASITILQGAIHQIDADPPYVGPDPVAIGVAAQPLIFGLLAGAMGVVLWTALSLMRGRERHPSTQA